MALITFVSTHTAAPQSRAAHGRLHRCRSLIVAGVVVAAMFTAPTTVIATTWWWNGLTTGLWTNGALWSNAASGGTRTAFVGASSFAATLSGVISGNASSSLSKTGVVTLVLSGSNPYGGVVDLSGL